MKRVIALVLALSLGGCAGLGGHVLLFGAEVIGGGAVIYGVAELIKNASD